ncbi:MAG: AAA family ATPase [Meiothermus sp.]|uniref:AAA family ATPase n=1 Tax=Meiothermus sp. TaxID=1955249 RepID=UPI002606E66B|nr:AAA family ATPase [Meiothermus sp.]MCS7058309.1 AAA family ATPase [Meiothermus sp.]
MRIERLIVQGFKSFGERTSLEFGPGVYGIVGPNGSGKSNLVEALRWAVGARARELRGEEALSLLFHGSEGRAPLGFAEVTLELGGNGRRVVLSRRLERDGSGEVRLGGVRSSLRQVEQALMGTGLSRNGYAIVGQGEVGQVLQAGPAVLLGYLEEAAGLRAVAQASRVAQERLELAGLELDQRARELAERRAVLGEKAAQLEASRKAKALAARALALKRGLLLARMREAEQEATASRERARALEAEREEVELRLKALEALRKEASEALEKAQVAYTEALRRTEALAGELRLVEQEQASLEQLLGRLQREREEQLGRLERLRSVGAPSQPQEPEPTLADLQGAELRLRELQQALRAEEERLRAQRRAYEDYLQAQASHQARRQVYEEARAQREVLEAEEVRLRSELEVLRDQISRLQARERELRVRLEEGRREHGRLLGEAQAALSEARRLEALLRSGADLAEGPKRARASGIPGIIGVVADLLQVPPGLELALEVALGGRMQWVLAEDEKAAQAAIEYLKRHGGRATFLPRSLLKPPRERNPDLSSFAGVVGEARRLVALPACPEALPVLLGETLVMENLSSALALARRYPQHPRLVTLEGELLESSGALTGGRVQRGGQVLALRRRHREALLEAHRLEEEARTAGGHLEALQAELEGLGLSALRQREAGLTSELRVLRSNLARLAQAPLPEAPTPVEPPDPGRLEGLRQEQEALITRLAAVRELYQRWQRYREEQERYRLAQQEAAQVGERIAALRLEEEGLLQRRMRLLERKEALERAREGLQLGPLEEGLRLARQQSRALEEEERRLLARVNQLLAELEALHLAQARREATAEALQQELAGLPPGLAEVGPPRALARALAEAEAALEALGPVNHLAEQEHALLEKEVGELEAALREAEATARRLEEELRRVEADHRERLERVYARFKERFAQYAKALLDAEAGLERGPQGLELVLRPAGKRTVSLGLLSMGERTMGALAFLFALAEVGESSGLPIAVLDEVDAPLDEANIQRFCSFLQRFKLQTQFILVTHQKRTMEACDALYGVTADRGVSRVYSVKRAEALV